MTKIHVPSRIPKPKTPAEAKRMIAAAKRLLKAAGVK